MDNDFSLAHKKIEYMDVSHVREIQGRKSEASGFVFSLLSTSHRSQVRAPPGCVVVSV